MQKRGKWKQVVILTEDILGAGGADDDLGPHGRNPNLDAGVAVLRQLTGEHLVQLREEHSIGHKLPRAQSISTKSNAKTHANTNTHSIAYQNEYSEECTFRFLLIWVAIFEFSEKIWESALGGVDSASVDGG